MSATSLRAPSSWLCRSSRLRFSLARLVVRLHAHETGVATAMLPAVHNLESDGRVAMMPVLGQEYMQTVQSGAFGIIEARARLHQAAWGQGLSIDDPRPCQQLDF